MPILMLEFERWVRLVECLISVLCSNPQPELGTQGTSSSCLKFMCWDVGQLLVLFCLWWWWCLLEQRVESFLASSTHHQVSITSLTCHCDSQLFVVPDGNNNTPLSLALAVWLDHRLCRAGLLFQRFLWSDGTDQLWGVLKEVYGSRSLKTH